MKVGIIVAIETDSVFAHYKDSVALPCPCGYELYLVKKNGIEIYVLRTGMGEIAASAGTQYLITGCQVDFIVNFGVVGGLTDDMSKHKLCIVKKVVHYKYDCSEFLPLRRGQVDGQDSIYIYSDREMYEKGLEICPELAEVTCCSGDKFVGTSDEKAELHWAFKGDVCDMESAGIVLTCLANNTPFIMLKAVSDGLSGGAGEFFTELRAAADKCLSVADEIIMKMSEEDWHARYTKVKTKPRY